MILTAAKKYGVHIALVERLPQGDFIETIKILGEKGGIVAQNGIITLLQAIFLKCPSLTYANKSSNEEFYKSLVSSLTEELQPYGEVLLGLTDEYKLLDNQTAVKKVFENIYILIDKASKKYELEKSSEKEDKIELSSSDFTKFGKPKMKEEDNLTISEESHTSKKGGPPTDR